MKIKDRFKNVDFFEGWIMGIACYIGVKIIVSVIAIIIALVIGAV